MSSRISVLHAQVATMACSFSPIWGFCAIDQPLSNQSCYRGGQIFLKHYTSWIPLLQSHNAPFLFTAQDPSSPDTAFCSTTGQGPHPVSSTLAPNSQPQPGHVVPTYPSSLSMLHDTSLSLQHPLNSSHIHDGIHPTTTTLLNSPITLGASSQTPGSSVVSLSICHPLCWQDQMALGSTSL